AETTEKTLDKIVAMIQQLNEKAGRSLMFGLTTSTTGITVPDPEVSALLGWNETGDALVNYTIDELAALLAASTGGGVPEGGVEYDLLERSDVDGEGRWTGPMVYQGFSERYNELVDLEGIKATID